ncbi:hypothetical protein ZWY2020_011065 [Hordeum vulgare]|nr:hypothetical protein ZWY2020_011065 [Hordeum vulgare]
MAKSLPTGPPTVSTPHPRRSRSPTPPPRRPGSHLHHNSPQHRRRRAGRQTRTAPKGKVTARGSVAVSFPSRPTPPTPSNIGTPPGPPSNAASLISGDGIWRSSFPTPLPHLTPVSSGQPPPATSPLPFSEGKGREEKRESEQVRRRPWRSQIRRPRRTSSAARDSA